MPETVPVSLGAAGLSFVQALIQGPLCRIGVGDV